MGLDILGTTARDCGGRRTMIMKDLRKPISISTMSLTPSQQGVTCVDSKALESHTTRFERSALEACDYVI